MYVGGHSRLPEWALLAGGAAGAADARGGGGTKSEPVTPKHSAIMAKWMAAGSPKSQGESASSAGDRNDLDAPQLPLVLVIEVPSIRSPRPNPTPRTQHPTPHALHTTYHKPDT